MIITKHKIPPHREQFRCGGFVMRAIELADYYDISLDYLAGRSNNKSYNADTPLAPDEIKIIELYRNLSERNKGKAELFIEQL